MFFTIINHNEPGRDLFKSFVTFVLQIRIKKPPRIGRKIFTRFANCRPGWREMLLKQIHVIHCNDPVKVHPWSIVFNPLMDIRTNDEIANGEIEIIH